MCRPSSLILLPTLQIGVKDVLAGALTTDAYDVLCIPGGYAPNWCDKLGQAGSELIEAFVASGGGFVGICAGAYLGSTWDLGLIDVDLPLIDRWARGRTDTCALGLTEAAAEQLGEVAADPRLAVRYCNGPLMEAHAGVTVLATFESELRGRRNKYPAEMRGTAAIVSGRYSGEEGDGGRVVLISPHPETSDGPVRAHALFRQLFRYAAGVLEPEPEPEPQPEPDGLARTASGRVVLEAGGLMRTASGRVAPVGGFALARQSTGCSCCDDDDAEDEAEAEDEDEEGRKADAEDARQERLAAFAQPEPEPEVAPVGVQQLPPPPKTMKDGYSVSGQPYVESAGLPILFTAPHGLQVFRNRAGGKHITHLRERWSTELALKLAAAAPGPETASFVIWNHKTGKKKDPNNLDPNYLEAEEQRDSPWHRALLRFKQRGEAARRPMFHIDVHGKKDRKKNLDLDIGMGPMEEHWDEDGMEQLKEHLEEAFTKKVFAGTPELRSKAKGSVGRMNFGVEVDPRLSGYWGCDTVMTMSHQAVAEGIPAIQLEVPYSMRERLMSDDALFARFAAAIYGAYDAVVASARVASADGTVVGPAMEAAALAQDPAPQQIGRETIARMLEECKAMDVAMAGRERMI